MALAVAMRGKHERQERRRAKVDAALGIEIHDNGELFV
jgi:hypothetical protein